MQWITQMGAEAQTFGQILQEDFMQSFHNSAQRTKDQM